LSTHHEVICEFNASVDQLKNIIPDIDVLIFRSGVDINKEVLMQAKRLSLLIRAGSGIDNLDLNYVNQKDLELIRIPEPGAKAVAELTFSMMLALSRNLITADRLTRQGRWAKHELRGFLLTGKTLGIVGVGNIGTRVGQLGVSWGMDAIGYDIDDSPQFFTRMKDNGIRNADFKTVVSTADYLSIHVPLDKSTRNMFNGEVFAQMKSGSYLINLARGGVVDEKALFEALTSGNKLRGAALDVHVSEGEGMISPLAELDNVILTPHIGAMTIDSQQEIGQRIIEIIEAR
jgi:phosphoglycerate dehydrogenase-like enzyme